MKKSELKYPKETRLTIDELIAGTDISILSNVLKLHEALNTAEEEIDKLESENLAFRAANNILLNIDNPDGK